MNYWFFIGEVFFVAFYFLCRLTSPQWRLTVKRFLGLAVEAVLGMGLAMFAFLPSVLAIMGNPRTGSDSLLLGGNLWYYSNPQRYLGILHSFFFAPDMPALNNFFPDHGAQWASLSAYLPFLGAIGVLAYWFAARGGWLKRLLAVSAILALVPMGNHLFVLENWSYYARWFYMPTLMMVLATAIALERMDRACFGRAIRVTGGPSSSSSSSPASPHPAATAAGRWGCSSTWTNSWPPGLSPWSPSWCAPGCSAAGATAPGSRSGSAPPCWWAALPLPSG